MLLTFPPVLLNNVWYYDSRAKFAIPSQ